MSGPALFDRQHFRRNLDRAFARNVDGGDFLLTAVAQDMAERLLPLSKTFKTAVDLSYGLPATRQVLMESGKADHVISGHLFTDRDQKSQADFIFDDASLPLADQQIDLITSTLTLHWLDDLPGALLQMRRALKPDGLLLATLLGSGTLQELRDVLMQAELELTGGASPRVAPFVEIKDAGALLQRAGFALPVADADKLTVRYDNMFALIRDLRAMGATSTLLERSRKPVKRDVFLRAAELYAENHSDADGRIRATFNVISLSGWAPHESQQKPLKPGSAKTSLAEALKNN